MSILKRLANLAGGKAREVGGNVTKAVDNASERVASGEWVEAARHGVADAAEAVAKAARPPETEEPAAAEPVASAPKAAAPKSAAKEPPSPEMDAPDRDDDAPKERVRKSF